MSTLGVNPNDSMADVALTEERGTLHFERRFAAPVEQVWAMITSPVSRSRWLAAGEIELHRGGNLELAFETVEGVNRTHGTPHRFGVVTQCYAPTLLTCWWADTTTLTKVVIEIWNHQSEAQLLVTHRNLALNRVAVCAASWHAHLTILDSCLKCERPASFETLFQRLLSSYRLLCEHCQNREQICVTQT